MIGENILDLKLGDWLNFISRVKYRLNKIIQHLDVCIKVGNFRSMKWHIQSFNATANFYFNVCHTVWVDKYYYFILKPLRFLKSELFSTYNWAKMSLFRHVRIDQNCGWVWKLFDKWTKKQNNVHKSMRNICEIWLVDYDPRPWKFKYGTSRVSHLPRLYPKLLFKFSKLCLTIKLTKTIFYA